MGEMLGPHYCETAAKFLQGVNSARKSPLEFAKPIDFVLVGTCSTGHGHGYFHHALKDDNSPNAGFFDEHVPQFGESAKVLLISECCGRYDDRFLEKLKRMYPHIEWAAPPTWDYCENIRTESVVGDLLHCGVLRNRS